MSVVAFTGLPGSGKSYGVVAHVILPAIRAGRFVVTNIPLNRALLFQEFPDADVRIIRSLEEYESGEKFRELPPGAVIVLDEVWRIWPAGIKAHEAPKAAKEFLYEHRHLVGADGYSTEIVLVTQDLAQISNFARLMVEKTMVATKMSAVGATGAYRVDMYAGAVCGSRGPKDRLLGQQNGRYTEEVWRYYKSHTKSQSVGKEIQPDKRGVIWKQPIFVLGLPFAAVAVLFAAFSMQRFFGGMGEDTHQAVESVQQAAAPGPVVQRFHSVPGLVTPAAAPAPVASVPLSKTWRLHAVIMTGNGGVAQAVNAEGATRALSINDCRRVDVPGVHFECELDGELVTSYSGFAPMRSLFGKQAESAKSSSM